MKPYAQLCFFPLLSLALFGCANSIDEQAECGFKPGMSLLVPGYCFDQISILEIASAAETDPKTAGNIYKRHIRDQLCTYAAHRKQLVFIEAVVHEFRDSGHRLTQVLKANPGDPDATTSSVYAIALGSLARGSRPESCSKK